MKKGIHFLVTLLLVCLAISITAQDFDGYALYNAGHTAYLIDKDGTIAHRWNCNYRGNYSMFLKDNGHLVRGAVNIENILNSAAAGGLVQELDANGDVVWEFTYSSDTYISHHDIAEMPDGGILLTAWEVPSLSELKDLGFQGDELRYPTHLIEVQQEGTGGKIVWEWHMKDHFVQDVDPSLPNYGQIGDNPQLMNINVAYEGNEPGGGREGDWFHVNGVGYDAAMDQIIFSSRFLSEIFIIDHSTTTAEAAGHAGGNSGKGGDFLWRWGNPANYNTTGIRNIEGAVHDAHIVPNDGRLFSDHVQIFNNEGSDGRSHVENIKLPRNDFNFTKQANVAYGPTVATAFHLTRDNAYGQSASYRLPNGNLYVNLSYKFQYEVDPDDNLVWQYADASSKGFRVTCDHPGVRTLIADGVLDDSQCTPSSTYESYENPYVVSPNPSNGLFEISNIVSENHVTNFEITDHMGQQLMVLGSNTRVFDFSYLEEGFYFLKMNFTHKESATKRLILSR